MQFSSCKVGKCVCKGLPLRYRKENELITGSTGRSIGKAVSNGRENADGLCW